MYSPFHLPFQRSIIQVDTKKEDHRDRQSPALPSKLICRTYQKSEKRTGEKQKGKFKARKVFFSVS